MYRHLLVPKWLTLCNQILKDAKLPGSWRQSTIITVLKPGRDPVLPSSYRPISLINQDAKIFRAVIASRVKQIVCHYVHKDQMGFLPGRDNAANIRRTLNSIGQEDCGALTAGGLGHRKSVQHST